jgi:hypothetical protein
MARYIDADKLCEALKSMASVQYPDKQNTILGVVSSIENFPTADVVPKSEVERLTVELDELAEEYSDLIVEKDQVFDIAEKQKVEIEALKIANEKMYSAIEATKNEVIEEYRQRVNVKMGKHTHLLGKEYVQRILREVAKEMKNE